MKIYFLKKETRGVLPIVMVLSEFLSVSPVQSLNEMAGLKTTDNVTNLEFLKVWSVSEGRKTDCLPSKNVKYKAEPHAGKNWSITNSDPGWVEISLDDSVDLETGFLWYADFSNSSSPEYNCLKLSQQNFGLHVSPDVHYLICLMSIDEFSQMNIFDCIPLKTRPIYENQTWLTNKSISLSVVSIAVLVLFALVTGALILYLLVRKNPSLIRGSKRVIQVKRHDKAHILVMPRGYQSPENTNLDLSALPQPGPADSCDTLSTVSYVSANQPTQLEILTYRLNRLREVFQRNNNLPPPVPLTPLPVSSQSQQRIPPNVDLLFEYEWYTITTTTTET